MEEEKHCIWPSKCKYDSSDVYPRGSSAANMFSISKISEFGLKGRGRIFNNFWNSKFQKFKKFRIIRGGGKPNWVFLPIKSMMIKPMITLFLIFNKQINVLYYDGADNVYSSSILCSWSLHEHAHEVLMSTCAHESFMSMLMKLPCARARGDVARTTTLGQYASCIDLMCRR